MSFSAQMLAFLVLGLLPLPLVVVLAMVLWFCVACEWARVADGLLP
jgi:hypothetical protein